MRFKLYTHQSYSWMGTGIMQHDTVSMVVAGHICLDVIPQFTGATSGLEGLLTPGQLVEVGPVITSTGGVVPNTGLALHQLGINTRLIGKIGNDIFGQAILDGLSAQDKKLARDILVSNEESSSYTIVISPPDIDRVFLHCPGTNDSYRASEIQGVEEADLFHFGYPPLMREIYIDGGRELAELFTELQAQATVTSLDMSQPDPDSEAGQVNWREWLQCVLPHVDIFAPSFDETLFMLNRSHFEEMLAQTNGKTMVEQINSTLLKEVSNEILDMGVAIIALKLGNQGLYLRTSEEVRRFERLHRVLSLDPSEWMDREMLIPCFQTDVSGTTGAGDTTGAGLLAAIAHQQKPETAITTAVGVGAFSVETPDAISGVPDWSTVQKRTTGEWKQRTVNIPLENWQYDETHCLMRSPQDKSTE